jgi:hypothetical protein
LDEEANRFQQGILTDPKGSINLKSPVLSLPYRRPRARADDFHFFWRRFCAILTKLVAAHRP